MNSGGTPVRTNKSSTMSTSLKERLKRCGRYHINSPTPNQPGENLLSPHPVRSITLPGTEGKNCYHSPTSSSSKEMHRKNPTKRKFDLRTGTVDVRCESLETDNDTLPLKKKVTEHHSEFGCGDATNTAVHYKSMTKHLNDSSPIHSNSQQCSCDFACDDIVSNAENTCDSRDSFAKAENTCDSKDIVSEATSSGTKDGNLLVSSTACVSNKATEDTAECSHCDPGDLDSLNSQLQQLDSQLKDKLELLRKLKMVKMYREKNDLKELQKLIDRWRSVSQTALSDLLQLHPEPRPQLGDLILHLQIDPGLVQFDGEEQDFY